MLVFWRSLSLLLLAMSRLRNPMELAAALADCCWEMLRLGKENSSCFSSSVWISRGCESLEAWISKAGLEL